MKAELNKKTQHPYRKEGFHLAFPNGHVWSCIDISKFDYINQALEYKDIQREEATYERVGKLYDQMGGRFEAMMVTENEVDDEHQLRAHSFEKLFKIVEQYEQRTKSPQRSGRDT